MSEKNAGASKGATGTFKCCSGELHRNSPDPGDAQAAHERRYEMNDNMVAPQVVKACEQSRRKDFLHAFALNPPIGRAYREPAWRWRNPASDPPKPPGDSPDFSAIAEAVRRVGAGD